MTTRPTLVLVPCFAGAPWDMSKLGPLNDWPLRTMRLPDMTQHLEEVVDYVFEQVKDLERYALIGDSFGAVVALAAAIRQPPRLQALVLSGGFAKNPITSPLLKTLAGFAPYFPGPFYRALTLRVHAAQLRSSYDREGEVPWTTTKTRTFFVRETTHRAYVNRVRAIERADYTERLSRISVPTLVLTPQEDRLIGRNAARVIVNGIRGAHEIVIPRTGHMFRFSHPSAYARQIQQFLTRISLPGRTSAG